jgi:DNA-binding MarR family transcriptional regulator
MTEQLDLVLPLRALARHRDPATSRAAAARVQAPTIAAKVLAELANGPGTTHELAARLGMSLVTVSPRMKPLEAANRVERAGERDGRTIWRAK